VWIDREQMAGDIFDAMEEGVRTSDVVVVVFRRVPRSGGR
jgi:hypothetical protein